MIPFKLTKIQTERLWKIRLEILNQFHCVDIADIRRTEITSVDADQTTILTNCKSPCSAHTYVTDNLINLDALLTCCPTNSKTIKMPKM